MLHPSLRTLLNGIHNFDLSVAAVYHTAGEKWSPVQQGQLVVVARQTSPFGAGWWVAGFEQLVFPPPQPFGGTPVLWIGGDGSARVYRPLPADTMRYVGPELMRPDTLLRTTNADSTWIRLLPGGDRIIFNYQGRHIATRNRLGYRTVFTYDASGRLSNLRLPVPNGSTAPQYVFTYPSGKVIVTAPSGTFAGVTQIRRDTLYVNASNGRLTSVGDSLGRHNFTYVTGTNRIWRIADRETRQTDITFDSAYHVATATIQLAQAANNIVNTFNAAESEGVASPVRPADVRTLHNGPRSGAGDVTLFWLTEFGAPARIQDAIAGLTIIQRGDPNFPGLVSRIDNPARAAGVLTAVATYTVRGNLLAHTVRAPHGGIDAQTQYEYDSNWPDFVKRVTTPAGITTDIVYDPANGNRTLETYGRAERYVEYQYFPNDLALMQHVLTPAPNGSVGTDSYEYDALGNVRRHLSPRGIGSEYVNDDAGRLRQERRPLHLNWSWGFPDDDAQVLSTSYDAVDRPVTQITRGGPLNGVPAQSTVVESRFDKEGRLLRVARWGSSAGDTIVTGARHDWAGRTIAALAPDATPANLSNNPKDSLFYDPAGNITTSIDRRNKSVTMTYDNLNRLRTRVTDTLSFGALTAVNLYVHPARSFVAESDTFAYDGSTAAFAYAANQDARTLRQYWPNGQVRQETQIIRTRNTANWTAHVYNVGYEYDRDGHRTRLTLPDQIAPKDSLGSPQFGSNSYIRFGYDPETGDLTSIIDPMGLTARAHYNASGTIETLVRNEGPNQFSQLFTFDADGNTSGWGPHTYTYDTFGRVLTGSGVNSAEYRYSGLGHAIHARVTAAAAPGSIYIASDTTNTVYDALGNLRSTQSKQANADCTQPLFYEYFCARQRSLRGKNSVYGTGVAAGRLISERDTTNTNVVLRYTYDAVGNVVLTQDSLNIADPSSTRSYYDVHNRLRFTTRRSGTGSSTDRIDTEIEYRYDALGRRVAVFTARTACHLFTAADEPLCEPGGLGVRTVWDGEQELGEIQRYGNPDLESDALPAALGNHWPMVGNVAYTPGFAIDQPISIVRSGYQDAGDNDGLRVAGKFNAFSMMPVWNREGAPEGAVYAQGTQAPCKVTGEGCVPIKILWPNAWSLLDGWRLNYLDATAMTYRFWHGSLLEDKKDATGLAYRRNRYYDPGSGRFTQEDPIGLAGGLNLYGFANGDPVNFSDPFGLKVTPDQVTAAIINRLLNGSATFRSIYRALMQASAKRVDIQVRVATQADHTRMFNDGVTDGFAIRYGLSARGDVGIDMRPRILELRRAEGISDEEVLAEEIVHIGALFRIDAKTGVPLACIADKTPCADKWKDDIMRELRASQSKK
ncbi:MAG: RHS repeat-associated core domain-containing protein [Longimicrobiales bacterium]